MVVSVDSVPMVRHSSSVDEISVIYSETFSEVFLVAEDIRIGHVRVMISSLSCRSLLNSHISDLRRR